MVYRGFPVEQARQLFEEYKAQEPPKTVVPKLGGRAKITIHNK